MSDHTPRIPREVLALAHFAASDDSRPVLSGVRVGETEAVASDGFVMAAVAFSDPLPVLTGRTLVKRAALKLLGNLRRAGSFAEYSQIDHDGLGETFLAVVKKWPPKVDRHHKGPVTAEVLTKTLFEAQEIPPSFPAYERFIEIPKLATTVALSPRILSQIVDAAEAVDAPLIRFYVRGPLESVKFRIRSGGEMWIRGAAMPMYCDWEDIP